MSEAIEEKPVEVGNKVAPLSYRADFNKSLAKFRQQVKAPGKNGHVDFTSKKGRTKYDYTLLDDLIKSIDEGTKDTGLSWRQEAETIKGGVKVRTIISHENGYDYTSPWITLGSGTAPQDVGSAITYAKRYSLGTTFGVSSESDDDGEAAQEGSRQQNSQQQNHTQGQQNNQRPSQRRRNQQQSNQQQSNQQRPRQQNQGPIDTNPSKLKSIAVLLQNIADMKNSTVEEMTLTYEKAAHGANFEHLTSSQAETIISMLTNQANKLRAEAAKQSSVDTDDINKRLGEMSDTNVRGADPTGAK